MALNHLSLLRPLLCQSLVRQVRSPLVATSRVRAPLLCPDTTCYPAACARLYATKKAKAKAKGQSSKVNINSALVEDIISLDEVKGDMTAVLNALKDDFTRNLSIRTSPGALDHIVVTTQDGKFPLNQLGQVSMKSPQLIMVNMSSFPEATVAATRALRESSMNLNPEVDGTIIKVPVPKVTREHRENLAKLAKQFGNKAKDSLRKVRSNAVTQVKKTKEGHSEDTIRLVEKQIQQMADNIAVDIDKQLAAKTKELLG
ncbi:ribosome-recycling factor, mitochondrial isoform X1 [Perca flavescens]|nr:ribosome-recycling factor, mitochondrial isoform X1 [Perca flavescens]